MHERYREVDQPAPALSFGHNAAGWEWVNTRQRSRTSKGPRAGIEAVKLTIQEALILQGFDPDYPVQGSRTKQFEQVGNAVPPPLAAHVLRALIFGE